MKVIIAGNRDLKASRNRVAEIVEMSGYSVDELVCGMATGIDMSGNIWASQEGIAVKEFPANWEKYGLAAGPKRNKLMADYADALIIIWDGKSKGTLNMIRQMQKLNKPYFVMPATYGLTLYDSFLDRIWTYK